MQDYASSISSVAGEYRGTMDSEPGAMSDRSTDYKGTIPTSQQQLRPDSNQYPSSHQYSVPMMQQKNYGYSAKDTTDSNMANYVKMTSGMYDASSCPHFTIPRHTDPSAPTFSSPPNSPLVGLVFDPASSNYIGPSQSGSNELRNFGVDQRSQSTWMGASPEQILPIGTGARKKIMKTQPDIRCYSSDRQTHRDVYFAKADNISDGSGGRKRDSNLVSESTTSLDFLAEGERMVSELCNVAEMSSNKEGDRGRGAKPYCFVVTKESSQESIETLLGCLDKIVIHDQIPNEIVQLAIEACTDAENIAIAHHNRPCFKNIHSICAKTRSNVQKSDSAVANLHSQGIPWVIKNFIFSFVRILDGWKGVKELLCEKHDTFSRIENKYYSPNIRECFFQWQAVTKEMLSHIYKTFKCLDQGFTMEQKSFTHNYYATNPTAPRHQNQSKFQPPKTAPNPPRPVSVSSQTYGGPTGHWLQNAAHGGNQSYSDPPWPIRSTAPCKKYPIVPQTNSYIYPPSEATDSENFHHKSHFKYDPGFLREQKPRQSWTITNMHEFRSLENINAVDQRQLYPHLKQSVDAELGNNPCPAMVEAKSKMIPVSHVEKTLIPSMASSGDGGTCYVQKKNTSSDNKEDSEMFTEWSRALQRDSGQYNIQHKQSLPVLSFPANIANPSQIIDNENEEFHDQSKVYMKPGSYKVPTKPSDSVHPFPQETTIGYENPNTDEIGAGNIKGQLSEIGAQSSMYSVDSWSCMQPNHHCDFPEALRHAVTNVDIRGNTSECNECVPSDRAWEAAKQSAPKLMDFIYDGSKSDTARLYDALGFSTTNDDYSEEYKRFMNPMSQNEDGINQNTLSNNVSRIWNQQEKPIHNMKDDAFDQDAKTTDNQNGKMCLENTIKRNENSNNQNQNKNEDDFSRQKNVVSRPKIAISALWYQPKKNKPISKDYSKIFEHIITHLSRMTEADFIQNDMDIKSAPRFYEVVKHPVCLTDISTKLKSFSYTDTEQVVHDFRRLFNNVRLYLKSYPDVTMKRNVAKVSSEFEKIFADEFKKLELAQDKSVSCDKSSKTDDLKKPGNASNEKSETKADE